MDLHFDIGQIVALRVDPTRSGVITAILTAIGTVGRYRVFHGPGDIREYYGDQLIAVAVSSPETAVIDALTGHQLLPARTFQARLTASRLAHPESDNLYSLRASRIQYIPFQFKPLLRLLRSEEPRLLIADEVGVGKTIESGLILKELSTRRQLDTVVVICPKALVEKWRMEMRRFDEDFRILTSENLRYCLHETSRDGAWPMTYSRVIIPLELIRIDEYLNGDSGRHRRPGLKELAGLLHFGLTIIDEAHHVRNPATSSYAVARFFCEASEAVLFLSATPVHLGSQNLHTLLNLLRPELFPDESVFAEMLEPNRYLNQAMRAVRYQTNSTNLADVERPLTQAATTTWGHSVLREDPRFTRWHERVRQTLPLTDAERIACLRDLEDVGTLAHIMNRTRRRDIGRFTIREPHTIAVPFTPSQEAFYQALLEFRRQVLLTRYDPRVVSLIIDTLERQASSCLPALIPMLDSFLLTGRFSAQTHTDDVEIEELAADVPASILDQAHHLREQARTLAQEDPKFDELQTIVQATLTGPGPGKVLIFSFFLHTLAYLQHHLQNQGYRVGLITGRLAEDERMALRNRFGKSREEPDAIDILLSSEVGCEGLDYQFCDRLVNYDLPWNPMRIEQRIGRIDRFGQQSEKVLIFNFITPGTVEERIFFRCFERLGIFHDTVGDLEEVLGELVDNLNRLVLDPDLTPAQAELQMRQMADNAIRLVEEQRRLEEESGMLLGLDQAYVAEVETLAAEGRFISPHELHALVEGYLETSLLGGRLIADESTPGLYRLRLAREGRAALASQIRGLEQQDRASQALLRWLEGNDPAWPLTFEQQLAVERRELAFITPSHPLVKIAAQSWRAGSEPLCGSFVLESATLPAGRYLFACELWETRALRPELRLVGFAWDLGLQQISIPISHELVRLLTQKHDLASAQDTVPRPLLEEGMRGLDEEALRLQREGLAALQEHNGLLVTRKLASLDAYYANRLQRSRHALSQTAEERIRRMRESEVNRLEHDYTRKREELERRRDADIFRSRVATGILEVRHGQ